MSIYMSRLFARSNSSFLLSTGNALQSQISRLREETFLVDSGPGTARVCLQDELTRVPTDRSVKSFSSKVGFLNRVSGEAPIKKKILERLFIDLVVGEPLIKERAASRFNDLVGSSTDSVAGEPVILLPKRFRQSQAWTELNKIWRANGKVNGFVIRKVRRGYAVAIAGYIAFLPFRPMIRKRLASDRFNIESISLRGSRANIVVF